MPITIPTKERKVEIETHPVSTDIKIRIHNDTEKAVISGIREKHLESEVIITDAMQPEIWLGSLYDRKKDQIYAGFSLWKQEKLQRDDFVATRKAKNQNWVLDKEGTLTSKLDKLNVEGGFNLSLCGDLVYLQGHANYFTDNKKTDDAAQVSLTYRETTVYKELTSEALKTIDYPEYLTDANRKDYFTHVVVGILYGCTCTMIFKKKLFENEKKEEINASLLAALEKIPMRDRKKLDMDETLDEITSNVDVSIYCDMKGDHLSISWDDAIDYYEQLPGKLSCDDKRKYGFPIKIYLLPKKALGSVHEIVIKELSEDVTRMTVKVIQSLNAAICKSSDLKDKTKQFPLLHEKLNQFQNLVEMYKATFQKDIIAVNLEKVRGGQRDEDLLYKVIEKHNSSPFGNLEKWLDDIYTEVNNKIKISNFCTFVEDEELQQVITAQKNFFVFTLQICLKEDIFIDNMGRYYTFIAKKADLEKYDAKKDQGSFQLGKSKGIVKNVTGAMMGRIVKYFPSKAKETYVEEFEPENSQKWFRNEKFNNRMTCMTQTMVDVAAANKDNRNIGFLVREIEASDEPNCYIELFQAGQKSEIKDFIMSSRIENLREEAITEETITIRWCAPKEGIENITGYKVTVKPFTLVKPNKENKQNENGKQKQDEYKIKKTENFFCNGKDFFVEQSCDENITYKIEGLNPNTAYIFAVNPVTVKNTGCSGSGYIKISTLPSLTPSGLQVEIFRKRYMKVKWKEPKVLPDLEEIQNYWLEYKIEGKDWKRVVLESNVFEYSFTELDYNTAYKFRILAAFKGKRQSCWSENVSCISEKLNVPVIVKAKFNDQKCQVKWKMGSDETLKYEVNLKHENKHIGNIGNIFKTIQQNDEKDELFAEEDLGIIEKGQYKIELRAFCEFGTSEWSEPATAKYDTGGFPFATDMEDIKKGFYDPNDVVTEENVIWAIKHQGFIKSNQSGKLPKSKKMAVFKLLQSISRMDYKCLNQTIAWEDEEGNEHKGVYHPMDLLHQVVDHLDIPSRCMLYQKLSMCKQAVPVCFRQKNLIYMNASLHQVKISWNVGDQKKESNVTIASIPVVSMIRIGRLSENFISKSQFANDILDFKAEAKIGSCGFFTKCSAASNNRRKLAKGNVEGVWFETSDELDAFESSFAMLNLRGNGKEHVDASLRLASATDILILFCHEDMFKDEDHIAYLNNLKKNTKDSNGKSVIKRIIIIFTKASIQEVGQCHTKFAEICSNLTYELFEGDYLKLLTSVQKEIQKSLKNDMGNTTRTLNERFLTDSTFAKEFTGTIAENAFNASNLFIKEMDLLFKASGNLDTRSKIRMNIFPLQSFTKSFAEMVRRECRSLNITNKRNWEFEAYKNRADQYQKISNGLPEAMSQFLRILFEYQDLEEQMLFIQGVQNRLDDWCADHLFQIRNDSCTAYKDLIASRDEEREQRKKIVDPKSQAKIRTQTEQYENLNKLLLDLSVGVESIFREIGLISESTLSNKSSLAVAELKKCALKLPELAASLLLEGISLEILDGDGLSCPIAWVKSVLNAAEVCFKLRMGIRGRDPKVFVLTVLGTQGTGKSTLLNTMFGVQFPVSSGRCTKGAFLQIIPLQFEACAYDAIILIDTEGLGAPEYGNDKTHDNEIATFVLGISDLALMNVRGELPLNLENFLEVSTAALMRMNKAKCHPNALFVHQNCDPSAGEKNISTKDTFIKRMNAAVQTQAAGFQMQDIFLGFTDIVNISINDDFFYFPQLFEGTPPMAPPSYKYSMACSKLVSYILKKMNSIYEKHGEAKTFKIFSEKVESVWNGVLKETFVFSLVNSAEIQARHSIAQKLSMLKNTMESQLNDKINFLSNTLEAFFKSTTISINIGKDGEQGLEQTVYETKFAQVLLDFEEDTNAILHQQIELFSNFIAERMTNKHIYKNWEQNCINELEEYKVKQKKQGDSLLKSFYTHKLNLVKLSKVINKTQENLQTVARETADNLISAKEKKTGAKDVVFTKEEINMEFEKFWKTVQDNFKTQNESAFKPVDILVAFKQVLLSKYGHTSSYRDNVNPFGKDLEHLFKNEWIRPEHLEFRSKGLKQKFSDLFMRNHEKWRLQVVDLVKKAIDRVQNELLKLVTVNDLTKMSFQVDTITFNCQALIKEYIVKVINILDEEYEKEAQRKKYKLTDQFKTIFCYYAAQKGISPFRKVQKSFLDRTYVSVDVEKENIKQLFTLLLKKEGELKIAATLITGVFHNILTKNKPLKVKTEVRNLISGLLTQKAHVHGLVLYDVIDIVTDSIDDEKSKDYLNLYFKRPFTAFKNKIKEVIEANKNLDIDARLEKNITSSLKELKKWLDELTPLEDKPLIDVICEAPVAIKNGIGKSDFNCIKVSEMPCKVDDKDLSEEKKNEEEAKYKKQNKKRMSDETKIITELRNLISETNGVNTKANETDKETIISTLITDVIDHLFECKAECPFCRAPCNETHSASGNYRKHYCNCHRPQGFATYHWIDTNVFMTQSCNELVNTDKFFRNPHTNWEKVDYKNYRSVNSDYDKWNIQDIPTDHSIYWRYITCKVMDKLDQFYPHSCKADVSGWQNITKDDCLDVVKNKFHLDQTTLTKDTKTGHYILT